MAERKIVAGQAMLLWTEYEGHASASCNFIAHQRREIRQRNHTLLRLAMRQRAGANGERRVCERDLKGWEHACVLEKIFGADRGLGFAPVGFIRGNNGQARESKVGHRAGSRSYIEGIARRDEYYFEKIVLAG